MVSRMRRAPRARPHCRTQAIGAVSATTLSSGVAHLRHQMDVLVAVDEVGQVAEGVDEGAQLRGDLDRQQLRFQPAQRWRRASFV